MRAITIRNPWAWAIIHAGKNVENRSRNIAGKYRGPVAIHAGLTTDDAAFDDDMVKDALGMFDDSWWLEEQIGTAGAFIGVADLVDVHEAHPARHAYDDVWEAACCKSPWGQRENGGVHLVLARPRLLPAPVPARGRLGLWTPDPEQLDQLGVAA